VKHNIYIWLHACSATVWLLHSWAVRVGEIVSLTLTHRVTSKCDVTRCESEWDRKHAQVLSLSFLQNIISFAEYHLFCRISSLLQNIISFTGTFAKETYKSKKPTHRHFPGINTFLTMICIFAKIIGLFGITSSLLQGYFAKETCNSKEPTNRHFSYIKRHYSLMSEDITHSWVRHDSFKYTYIYLYNRLYKYIYVYLNESCHFSGINTFLTMICIFA